MPKAFDVDAEVAKAKEKVNRGIGQRVRHAKAETKRLADAARAEIAGAARSCAGCYWEAKGIGRVYCRRGYDYGDRCREYKQS